MPRGRRAGGGPTREDRANALRALPATQENLYHVSNSKWHPDQLVLSDPDLYPTKVKRLDSVIAILAHARGVPGVGCQRRAKGRHQEFLDEIVCTARMPNGELILGVCTSCYYACDNFPECGSAAAPGSPPAPVQSNLSVPTQSNSSAAGLGDTANDGHEHTGEEGDGIDEGDQDIDDAMMVDEHKGFGDDDEGYEYAETQSDEGHEYLNGGLATAQDGVEYAPENEAYGGEHVREEEAYGGEHAREDGAYGGEDARENEAYGEDCGSFGNIFFIGSPIPENSRLRTENNAYRSENQRLREIAARAKNVLSNSNRYSAQEYYRYHAQAHGRIIHLQRPDGIYSFMFEETEEDTIRLRTDNEHCRLENRRLKAEVDALEHMLAHRDQYSWT